MSENGNNPQLVVRSAPVPSRMRASWPILLLAVLFVMGAFLTWYFTWFGRELSDADVSKYLLDEKNPRHVQHALLQLQVRIDRKEASVKQWYPRVVQLAGNPETELRLTVAWLMGFDNQAPEFHTALQRLLKDAQPIVRRNAALALVRFNDTSGREELRSVLELYQLRAPVGGVVRSTLPVGSEVSRGTLLVRFEESNQIMRPLRSPLPGKVEQVHAQVGATLAANDPILSLRSDEESVWEALRALALIGKPEDLPVIEQYLQTQQDAASDRLKEQARLATQAIQRRSEAQNRD
jgi:biotin carboxyl carrier protein